MDHLRYAGLPFDRQRQVFLDIVWAEPLVRDALARAHSLALPDWRIVSGVLYNTVWNALTGRPSGHGIKDIDLFYFDTADLSYEAEDEIIRAGAAMFADMPVPVEIRNQARVHLWYPQRFGQACPKYVSSDHAIRHFASETHAVGVRLEHDGQLSLYAPFGLDHILSFRVAPNRALDNRATHEEKGARAKRNWPEITVVPW
ncbi:nucleotidyltransferase family protein [Mesorhizobium sp. BAC0120]|uniref:nucleotidyltransferase family protein n=1 Tax=Mesorhizobium sp. BAC0120 TaxID=3090670 RepID=UPI00298CA17D|nr:nucleotidyltransferase family protein [Mesorhizobium sp. BAC0120]MDW6024550.1 nucleotidyltransferase family protein [Mesorhizobium sp. BAC0120]